MVVSNLPMRLLIDEIIQIFFSVTEGEGMGSIGVSRSGNGRKQELVTLFNPLFICDESFP